ncbi:hypothetical protein NQ176_g5981 [Zarea fungicola]|uniref:Uncharacterized protein n=1 Tax=Zarea fungicola TaxID=93591 RepID=A0ACC1N649_9HYPO|nr:hypothetical protein NQ176_g5981 [Lecanicillium fungicola]
MAQQLAMARRNIRLNEAVAKESLELRKIYAEQCAKTQEHATTLQQQLFALESANNNQETLGVMQHATKGVKKSGDKLSPEQMNKITERLQEHNAACEAIAEARRHIAIATPADSIDVETELENLRNEQNY